MTNEQLRFLNLKVIWPYVINETIQESKCIETPIEFLEEFDLKQTLRQRTEWLKSIRQINWPIYRAAINSLKNSLQTKHAHLFVNGKVTIGICQMIIGQYLKMCWCMIPDFPEPWACPIYGNVFDLARRNLPNSFQEKYNHDEWYKIDSFTEFLEIIEILRKDVTDRSLAVLELEYNSPKY